MNKILLFFIFNYFALSASEIHLLNDINYKNSDETYNMVVEIPSGTLEKWEVSKKTGTMKLEIRNSKPRIVNFLPYVGNYGFIPQTKLLKSRGGDGDPVDVLLLSSSIKRGEVVSIKIIGGLKFFDRGEIDTKLIAVPQKGSLSDMKSIKDIIYKKPNMLNIIKLWFEGYKGFGKMQFMGYLTKKEAINNIKYAYKDWKRSE